MGKDNKDFQILNTDKSEISYNEMLHALQEKKIVFFGEFHENQIIHALQLRIYEDLNKLDTSWAIGMEMLERHQNRYLQEFVNKSMNFQTFTKQAKQWPNFERDYLPLIQIAQKFHMPVIATNVPRYLASKIAREGWDSLNNYLDENPMEKKYIAKLPLTVDYEAPGYRDFKTLFSGDAAHGMDIKLLTDAQAIKDATMAESILQFLKQHSQYRLLHIQGVFHNQDDAGILWYLRYYNNPYSYSSIEVIDLKENKDLDIKTKADYYIILN